MPGAGLSECLLVISEQVPNGERIIHFDAQIARRLPRRNMRSVFAPAFEQEICAVQIGLLAPGGQRLPGLGGEFELNRLLRFLLQSHGALEDLRTICDVAYLELHQITTAQFAIDGQIEHGQVTGFVRHLESGADDVTPS